MQGGHAAYSASRRRRTRDLYSRTAYPATNPTEKIATANASNTIISAIFAMAAHSKAIPPFRFGALAGWADMITNFLIGAVRSAKLAIIGAADCASASARPATCSRLRSRSRPSVAPPADARVGRGVVRLQAGFDSALKRPRQSVSLIWNDTEFFDLSFSAAEAFKRERAARGRPRDRSLIDTAASPSGGGHRGTLAAVWPESA